MEKIELQQVEDTIGDNIITDTSEDVTNDATVLHIDSVGEIVTFQSILVVLIAIIYVLSMTFYPTETTTIASKLKKAVTTQFNLNDVIYNMVQDVATTMNENTPPTSLFSGIGGEIITLDEKITPLNVTLGQVIYTGETTFPVDESNLTSEFGIRNNPKTGEREFHNAIDLGTKYGSKIYAAATGEIIKSKWSNELGYHVIIEHDNGFKTKYGHCSKLLVNVGDEVTAGDEIALIGSTGNSTGPHLHFATSKNGVYFNPQHLYTYIEKWNIIDD